MDLSYFAAIFGGMYSSNGRVYIRTEALSDICRSSFFPSPAGVLLAHLRPGCRGGGQRTTRFPILWWISRAPKRLILGLKPRMSLVGALEIRHSTGNPVVLKDRIVWCAQTDQLGTFLIDQMAVGLLMGARSIYPAVLDFIYIRRVQLRGGRRWKWS